MLERAKQEIKKLIKLYGAILIREWFVGKFYDVDKDKKGAFDIEDPRDYKYEEVFGAVGELPEEYSLRDNLSKIQNQYEKYKTRMYCTCYAMSSGVDILEGDNLTNFKSGEELGDAAILLELLNPKQGAYLIDILNYAKDIGLIDGFTKLKSVQEMKQAISNNQPIYLGSNKVNWTETKKTGVFTLGTSYGHCFGADGYNKVGFQTFDSDGSNGYTIKYEDVMKILFNGKYALHLNNEYIDELKKMITYFTEQKEKGKQVINSYTALGKTYRKVYQGVIMLAIRKVHGKEIRKEHLIKKDS